MQNRIEKRTLRPNCAGNPTDNWYGEVRNNGFLIYYTHRKTEQELTQALLEYHGTEIHSKLAGVYSKMMGKYSSDDYDRLTL